MGNISYFIDTDFSEYDSEVFNKEQITDAFISAIRSISYDDDGVTVCLGASEPVNGKYLVISAIVYSDRCTLELYKDADDKEPAWSKDVSYKDAIKAFNKFYKGTVPEFPAIEETEPLYMIETNFTEYPIPVRDKRQIEELITLLPDIDDEDIICDEYSDEGAFVALIAPDEVKGAEYVQVMFNADEGWYVEISFVDRKKRVNFAELFGDESEIIRIFNDFFKGSIPDISDWTKVKI